MIWTPHQHVATKIRDAVWTFGTPGILYARYKCEKCGVEWDDLSELPETSQYVGWRKETADGVRTC